MAGHTSPGSLRKPSKDATRPGKTLEDKRIGAWASKSERNGRQAAYREACDRRTSKIR